MIPKKFEEISETDIEGLATAGVSERKTLDYKRSLPGTSDGEKKEFLADVSSFANTAGGDLIFGIDEAEGFPTQVVGVTTQDIDQEIRRLDSMIADGLAPRIKAEIRPIRRNGRAPVLVIRTERSWLGPHRVIFKGHDKFYARNSAGKYPLDVGELRAAFAFSSSTIDRIRDFRVSRLMALNRNEAPVALAPGGKTVLHIMPFESFSGQATFDVLRYAKNIAQLPPLIRGSGWGYRINLNGIVSFNSGPEPLSYTQLYRSGVVEAVESTYLNNVYQGDRVFPHVAVERAILEYLALSFGLMKTLGINPPVVIGLALLGAKGVRMAQDQFSFQRSGVLAEQSLILDETVVQDFSVPAGKILKPVFDLVWNAFGYEKTENVDDQGNWIARN